MLKSQEVRKLAPEMDPLRMGMGWKVEELDDSFVDAVMGGLLSALGDFASMFGNLGGGAIDNPFAGGDDFGFSDIFGDSDSGNPFDTLAPLAA